MFSWDPGEGFPLGGTPYRQAEHFASLVYDLLMTTFTVPAPTSAHPEPSPTLRVGAGQFCAGTDGQANLAACLRLIDKAAEAGVRVFVLPEFSNHAAWYDDAGHAWQVAITVDGPFASAVAERAATHQMYIQLNVSVRMSAEAGGPLTTSNLLFGPDGTLVGRSDKSVLMGNENTYFTRASVPNPILALPIGRVGLYACMEGVITEPVRALAVQGAELLLNSLNSFATDEASLHIPVRAAENGVWVVAANKVGPIVPVERLDSVASMLKVPPSALNGGGESQIVAPDGTVLAKASRDSEEIIWADIHVADASAARSRPDGTDRLSMRRPSLYTRLGDAPEKRTAVAGGAAVLVAAVAVPTGPQPDHVAEAVRAAVARGAQLIVLPELCGLVEQENATHLEVGALIDAIATSCSDAHVVTSLPINGAHVGVVIGAVGIVHRQDQLHRSARHEGWHTSLGSSVDTVDLPWGRLAVIVGDDLVVPEVARLAALAGCHVIAAPITIAEPWEVSLGLIERSAENRVSLVAASAAPGFDGGILTSIPAGMTLWTEGRERPFDGSINVPDLVHVAGGPGVTLMTLQPVNAANKVLSRNTDLLDGRPWHIAGPLITP